MIYKILADLMVALHLAWIVFFSWSLVGRAQPTGENIHLSGLGFAVLLQVFDWYCPLTHLEVYLRGRHDPATSYTGGFVIQYLERMIYPQVPRYVLGSGPFFLLDLIFLSISGLGNREEDQNKGMALLLGFVSLYPTYIIGLGDPNWFSGGHIDMQSWINLLVYFRTWCSGS